MIKIHINVDTPYDIYLGAGILNTLNWTSIFQSYAKRFVVISDTTVSTLYREKLLNLWSEYSPLWLNFEAGEASKTRETKALLEDQLQEAGVNRDACMIAVGGGVVCDLAGFLAATYNRGVPVIYIPTTLLAMVDASVGGKTGVNTSLSKNSIGVFSQPKAIYMDIDFLNTLPDNELQNGLAEILKHSLIRDVKQFERLLKFRKAHSEESWLLSDKMWLLETIAESIRIKKEVVVCDEKETGGLRQILNFGHTIGHAIEQLSGYTVAHGEAVAIGIYLESYLSYCRGYLSWENFSKIEKALKFLKFQLNTPYLSDLNAISNALSVDKKSTAKEWRMVFLKSIGTVCDNYVRAFDKADLEKLLTWYRESL